MRAPSKGRRRGPQKRLQMRVLGKPPKAIAGQSLRAALVEGNTISSKTPLVSLMKYTQTSGVEPLSMTAQFRWSISTIFTQKSALWIRTGSFIAFARPKAAKVSNLSRTMTASRAQRAAQAAFGSTSRSTWISRSTSACSNTPSTPMLSKLVNGLS